MQITRKWKYTLWLVGWRKFQFVQTSSHLIHDRHFQWKMSRYKSGNKPSTNYHSLGIQLSTHFKYFGQSLNSQLRWTSLVSPQLWSWLCWSWQVLAKHDAWNEAPRNNSNSWRTNSWVGRFNNVGLRWDSVFCTTSKLYLIELSSNKG